jgi:hypothetical protein
MRAAKGLPFTAAAKQHSWTALLVLLLSTLLLQHAEFLHRT